MEIPDLPTHSLKVIDNSTGDGDIFYMFAFERDGVFYSHDTGNKVLAFVGDVILIEQELSR